MNIDRWLNLMCQLGLNDNRAVYAALFDAYTEKHRHYHTDKHISACLHHLDESRHLAHQPAEVELAFWFHDAVYKRRSSTNELDSANWCCDFLSVNQVDKSIGERVHQLIMATCHSALPETNDEQLVVDIDLAILGAPDDIYWQFETNVRKEFQWVPAFVFRAKRKTILQEFLHRSRIYHHDYFYKKLEQQARTNLTSAIAHL